MGRITCCGIASLVVCAVACSSASSDVKADGGPGGAWAKSTPGDAGGHDGAAIVSSGGGARAASGGAPSHAVDASSGGAPSHAVDASSGGGEHDASSDAPVEAGSRSDASIIEPRRGLFVTGVNFSCGIDEQHHAVCFGSKNLSLAPPAGSFSLLSAGGEGVCGVDEQGGVKCWGPGPNVEDIANAVPPGPFVAVAAYSLSYGHACGIRPNGELVCWGSSNEPLAKAPVTSGFSRIATSNSLTCGLRNGGSLLCWGTGTPPDSLTGPFVDVAVSDAQGCVLSAAGRVSCWGPTHLPDWLPTRVRAVQLAAAPYHSELCALLEDGSWACDSLGSRTYTYDDARYTEITVDGTGFICGVREDRSVGCWDGISENYPPADFRVAAP
jgi:hypothetical protein